MGSFETIYTDYQTIPTDLVIDHAHDDFAEVLAETGLIGGLLILIGLGLFFKTTFRMVRKLHSTASWIRLGADTGCCGVLIHSFVDFNLHIPANAAWMTACAALATSFIGKDEAGQESPSISNRA